MGRALAAGLFTLVAAGCHPFPFDPHIDSFSPTHAEPGDLVTVRGRDLHGTVLFYFGDAQASTLHVAAGTHELQVRVPPCARSGPLIAIIERKGCGTRLAVAADDFVTTAPLCPYHCDSHPGDQGAVCDLAGDCANPTNPYAFECWMAEIDRSCRTSDRAPFDPRPRRPSIE